MTIDVRTEASRTSGSREAGSRVRQQSPADAEPASPDVVSAPADDLVYSYCGPQMRWAQALMTASFLLAAVSLARFASGSPLLYAFYAVLALNLVGMVLRHLIDLNDLLCADEPCPVVRNGLILYRDTSHVTATATAAATLAPAFHERLRAVLPPSATPADGTPHR